MGACIVHYLRKFKPGSYSWPSLLIHQYLPQTSSHTCAGRASSVGNAVVWQSLAALLPAMPCEWGAARDGSGCNHPDITIWFCKLHVIDVIASVFAMFFCSSARHSGTNLFFALVHHGSWSCLLVDTTCNPGKYTSMCFCSRCAAVCSTLVKCLV